MGLIGVGVAGRLAVRLYDAASGLLVAEEHANNLLVTTGLSQLASALNYSLILSENVSWGSPYSPPSGVLYGAVGTGNTAPVAGNTALVAEIGRAAITTSAVTSNVVTYDFFFGTAAGNGTIAEVGTFSNANLLAPTLTSGLTSGNTYTSLPITGLTGTIPASSTLTIGYSTGTTQQVTTSAQATAGASSISVTSFIASANFASGTQVAYTPGTMLDRAVLGVTVTKTASQTMIVELNLTLTSG